ncbi:MAG: hypothetical protein U0793_17700 [Gemmataceae bacterium]
MSTPSVLAEPPKQTPVLDQPAPTGARGIKTPAATPAPAGVAQRLLSLDTYRGLIMVTLAFNGFGLAATARAHLEKEGPSTFWQHVYFHSEHAEWTGGGYWDMIQPSFMFMVGVAMAFSYAKRQRLGQSRGQMLRHAIVRSLILILLGIALAYWRNLGAFFDPDWKRYGPWGLMNVLTQIGLGYTFLFLLWGRSFRVQAGAAAAILVGTWLLYVAWPGTGIDIAKGAPELKITQKWAAEHLTGIAPAWHKSANAGQDIDLVWLNALPQVVEYKVNTGGYQTINFIPSLATMLFGLMCGELLRSGSSSRRKLIVLFLGGLGGIAAGVLLDQTGACPLVKRIWTPSWALYSTGICCLILGSFYGIIDVLGYRRWTFFLVVVGMNSIAIYAMSMVLKDVVVWPLKHYYGADVFKDWAGLYAPMLQYTLIGLVFWLACYVMYRFKIFVRI